SRSRWSPFSPATRNVPDWAVREVGQAGGVVGVVLSTQLLGGSTIAQAVRVFDSALELAGEGGVAIGSDMDGGLRMLVDAAGLPLLTDGLLRVGLPPATVRRVLGGNALRMLAGDGPTVQM
ncbi:MAG TPA: membrane dipeptidase, partial [Candidatus Limnocylindria bacterium]|nr:membrane dipeptidase [Candidatus Limnocylindria bacterium]